MYADRSDTGHKKKVSLIIKADDWRYLLFYSLF